MSLFAVSDWERVRYRPMRMVEVSQTCVRMQTEGWESVLAEDREVVWPYPCCT
jgi:hypothetical protein